MKCGHVALRADWYLTTKENEWNHKYAKLNVDKQMERKGKCKSDISYFEIDADGEPVEPLEIM